MWYVVQKLTGDILEIKNVYIFCISWNIYGLKLKTNYIWILEIFFNPWISSVFLLKFILYQCTVLISANLW